MPKKIQQLWLIIAHILWFILQISEYEWSVKSAAKIQATPLSVNLLLFQSSFAPRYCVSAKGKCGAAIAKIN